MSPPCTTSPAAPRNCRRCASASAARSARARPRCSRCCARRCATRYDLVAITNDIYTKEDQRLLTVSRCAAGRTHHGRGDRRLPAHGDPRRRIDQPGSDRPHAGGFPDADVVFVESGGDNLAATFSPELTDLTIYVIDVAAGEKIPRKGGPGITKSDLFVINKTDLAPLRRRRSGRDGSRHATHAHKRAATQAFRDDQPEDQRPAWPRWCASSSNGACCKRGDARRRQRRTGTSPRLESAAPGRVAEWSIAPVLKTGNAERRSRVRIPALPARTWPERHTARSRPLCR